MPDPHFRLQRYQRQLLISFEPPPSRSSCKRTPPVGVNLATLLIEAATGMKEEEERNEDDR